MGLSTFQWTIASTATLCIALVLSLFFKPSRYRKGTALAGKTSASVLVLGDIGRSPRMQYHALSLAKHGATVNIVGFTESSVHPEIANHHYIKVAALTPPLWFLQSAPKSLFVIAGPLKVIWQTLNLFWVLAYATNPTEWMLVQNPPSIPVLAVAQLICTLRGTKLIIDWHNLGWSVLALKLGPSHPFVLISRMYEALFAKGAAAHFAVTKAMAAMLKRDFGIHAVPLHDRPMEIFKPLTSSQRREFLEYLPEELPAIAHFIPDLLSDAKRIRLIVSSTSWTPDEDFSILLDALKRYSKMAGEGLAKLPKILAVITGKGPQKLLYAPLINAINKDSDSSIFVLTGWLSNQSYASLLGAADLGISLHISTSGVDLPMKVVDMLGTGLPVAGWSHFEAWPELITEGTNGRGFKSSEQLSALLGELFKDGGVELLKLRQGALSEGKWRWDDEWEEVASKVFGLTKC